MVFLSNQTLFFGQPIHVRIGCMLLFLVGLVPLAQAQTQVQVLVNVNTPYSAYLQDYAGAGQQVQIRLINTSGRPIQIRLQGSVTGDNGVSIRTLPNYRPPIPFVLPPGTTLLARKDLEGLFDLNQITVEGMDKNLLYQGKPLPEGNYQVCVQVFDNRTSQVLSAGEPLGCSPPFPVKAIEPPILIAPLCDGEALFTTPQATVFTWTPPAGILPTQVCYTLRVVELPLENVDPNVFIDAVVLPPSGIEIKNLPTSTFLYGPQYLPLKVGKRYAWRVQAVDKFGRLNLLNDGKSPVCAFRYGPADAPLAPAQLEPQLVFIRPNAGSGRQLPRISVGIGNLFKMSWKPAEMFANQLRKTLALNPNSQPGKNQKTVVDELPGLTYSLRIYDLKTGKPVLNRQVKTEYLETESTELPTAFAPGKDYRAEVSLLGLTPVQLKKLGLPDNARIEAEPRLFTLVKEDKGDPTDSLTVKGTLAFRYPGETGEAHRLPKTKVALQKIFPNKYRATIAYGVSDAEGNYSIRVLRSVLHGADTTQTSTRCLIEVVNPFIQPLADAGYYQNSDAGTFSINRSQTGVFSVDGVTYLASGYRLAVTVRQAYKNWPGAPDVKLDGKQVVLYRKPGLSDYDKYRLPVEGQRDLSSPSTASTGQGLTTTTSVSNAAQKVNGTFVADVKPPASVVNGKPVGNATATQANGYGNAGLGGTTATGPLTQANAPMGTATGMTVTGFDATKLGSQVSGLSPEQTNRLAIEQAGYVYIGTATVQSDGKAYVTSFDRLTYSVTSSDRYSIYCPDCGQEPQDAESFAFQAPKTKLAPLQANVESYTFAIQTTEAPTMTFTGQLNYKFADAGKEGAQVKPLGNTQVHLQVVYRDVKGGTFSTQVPAYAEFNDFHAGFSATLDTKVTKADGSFSFSVKLTKPMKLGVQPPTQVAGSGEFTMPSATYVRALRVVVDNPYYASPTETYGDASTEQLIPLGTADLGAVTAVVKSYSLAVQIKSDTTGLSKVLVQQAGVRQELSGVKISVLRLLKADQPGPNRLPPVDEGTAVKATQKIGFYNYTVIATDKSNDDGVVNFPRMVMANGEDDAYFVATESSVDGLNNYKLVSLKRITVSEGWGTVYTITPTDAEKKQAEKAGKTIPGYAYVNCKTNWYVRKPVAPGSLTSEIMGPMSQAQAQAMADKAKGIEAYPKEEGCQQATGYWVGDKLKDNKINSKVLLTAYSPGARAEFADQYSAFVSDVVERFLAPGPPIINVRVVDRTNPTKGVKAAAVRLTYIDTKGNAHASLKYTGENGWIPQPFVTVPGTNARIEIKADGYLFNGYAEADKDDAAVSGVTEQKVNIGTLLLGQNAYYPRMLMQPNTRIVGWTVDTDSLATNGGPKPSVEAYAQVDDGFYEKTWWSSTKKAYRFSAYAPGGKADSLKIYPVNISYFNEYRLVKNLPKPVPNNMAGGKGTFIIDAGEIPIYQRDHRIDFILVDKLGKKVVQGGTVKLLGRDDPKSTFGPSDEQGMVETRFKNVSTENLFVEVSAPGYVTKTQSVTNVESKSSRIQLVFMEAANLIKGVVVVKTADGKEKPLPGAEVFTVGGSNAQTPYSTTAGAGGVFTLAVGKQFSDITIQATYREGSFISGSNGTVNLNGTSSNVSVAIAAGQSYMGATEKNYKLPQAANTSLKLTLTTFDKYKIATIWGFPIKVESFTALSNNYVQVSGEVELSSSQFGPFGIIDPDVRVRFEKVVFKPSATDPTQGEPVDATVKLKLGILDNLGYYSKAWKPGQTPIYNVRLTALESGYSGGNFQIVRKEGSSFGVVYAQAQVIDNSFNFSENLFSYEKGQFFLYDPKQDGQPGNRPFVVAFDASGSGIKRSNFGLSRKDGKPMAMKLLAFKATSSLEGSRLVGDEIQLNPTLTCTINDAQPSSISVTVGKLVLRNNTVDAKSGDTPLTFALAGNWSVEVRNWKLDYKQGGFYSTEGVVKTGKVDVPISLFNLRADFLDLKVEPTSKLSLAGLANLDVNGQAFFGYDAATGSDMKGHWSLVVVPKVAGGSAAKLGPKSGLPGLDSLDFETVSLLDNGEDVMTFGAGSKSFNFFGGVIKVRPKTIETGKDYFAFDAGMSTKIPNAPQDVQMRFTYSRPAGQQKVALKTTIPAEYVIDTKGQIAFKAGDEVSKDGGQKKAFYFADGVMAIRGMAEEPGKLKLGDPSTNALLLVHSVKKGFTHITHDRGLDLNDETVLLSLTDKLLQEDTWQTKPLAINLGGKSFQSMYCHQRVTDSKWELLKFSGIPGGFEGIEPAEENRINFTAYGEIKAENQKFKPKGIDSGNGTVGKDGSKVGASGVGTPFGNMELVYDMSESRFTGTLQVPGLAVGGEGMSAEGTAQIRIDPQGFYFVLGGMVKNVPLIIPVDMKGGVMVGWYGSTDIGEASDILLAYSHRKALPCAFKTGFKGFFCVGEIPVPLVETFKQELSVPAVGGYKVGLDAYVDGYLYGNYDSGALTWGSGLGVGVHAYAYGKILVVSASGDVYVNGSADAAMTLKSNQVTVDLDMNMSAGFGVALAVDPPGDLLDTSVNTSADFCLTLKGKASYVRGDGFSVKPAVDCKFDKCGIGCTVNETP